MNNSHVLVTIAIPVYNGMPYLRYAIQSVINQTNKDWILYLINDGSSDGSLDIMKEFASKDGRVYVVNDGMNRGLVYRLNQSIAMCKTKYYARMDADDIMHKTRIEEQLLFLESHVDIDVCGTSIMTIDNNNKIIGSGYTEGRVKEFFHPTVMGKSSWFKSNLYADWALRAEDYELWIRTSANSNFYAIGKPLLFYREFGIPTLKKYYLSQRTIIHILSRFKVYNKSLSWSIINILKTFCKIIVYGLFEAMGKQDHLISRRGRNRLPHDLWLTEKDLCDAINI